MADSPTTSEDVIPKLLSYCQDHQVYLSPKVAPKRVEGRGLGMYAVDAIAKGERLVHVPTDTLFTTKRIPVAFADARSRKGIPVHALLAAYFAFGDDEQHSGFAPWLATWPRLSDFTSSVPMLWSGCSREILPTFQEVPRIDPNAPYSSYCRLTAVPPPLTGAYLTSKDTGFTKTGSTMLVEVQLAKLGAHIKSLGPILEEEVWQELQKFNSPTYFRFVHMWLCVNTRCFSYSTPGTKAPTDPNEAMALCPGMDLFNHAEKTGVRTKYDKSGYFVVADRAYAAGEEILFSYGLHNNDVLWAEYGFLLEQPPSYDAIRIDKIVLAGLDAKQKVLLEAHGYLNEYWMSVDGVCWRTEIVAWLSVLSKPQWESMLEGKYDPEQEENAGKHATTAKRKRDGHVKAHRTICASWVAKVEADASITLKELDEMSHQRLLHALDEHPAVIRNQFLAENGKDPSDEECSKAIDDLVVHRQVICMNRWAQIKWLSMRAREKIEGASLFEE